MHVAAYGLSADLETEVHQFTADALAAPQRVLPGHSHEQVSQFLGDSRTAGPLVAALPGPVALPCLAMPENHGLRLDDEQG